MDIQVCDVCEESAAAVKCKADNAVLCLSCDHHVHSANPLALRHHRIPLLLHPPSSFNNPFFSPPSLDFFFHDHFDSVVPILNNLSPPPPPPPPPPPSQRVCMVPECDNKEEEEEEGEEEGEGEEEESRVLKGWEREERVRRYREKRSCRNFMKKIRYQSRKAYAEMRPRFKGRFVNATALAAAAPAPPSKTMAADDEQQKEEEEEEEDEEEGCGLVPTF